MNTDANRTPSIHGAGDLSLPETSEPVVTTELKPARLRNDPAAAYVGMTPRALAALRYRGGGPRYQRSGTAQNSLVYYLVADLDAWMAEKAEQSAL